MCNNTILGHFGAHLPKFPGNQIFLVKNQLLLVHLYCPLSFKIAGPRLFMSSVTYNMEVITSSINENISCIFHHNLTNQIRGILTLRKYGGGGWGVQPPPLGKYVISLKNHAYQGVSGGLTSVYRHTF